MLNFLLPNFNFGGLTLEVSSQYHRASERCMSHVRQSFKRIIKETEKLTKLKLSKVSYIREHDRVSHSAQVTDSNRRRFYICLMLGDRLYLNEFSPGGQVESFYVIAGLKSYSIVFSAANLRNIFDCIPNSAYDLNDGCCSVSKEDFLLGVHIYATLLKPKKS